MQQYLAELIKINGPISLSHFMNEALFNPKHGYYTNQNPFGRGGDFVTSPEISQVFGELVGAYLINLWQTRYEGGEVSIVEMGAGKGTLMKDLLRFANKIPSFLEKVNLNIIEISPKLQKIQQDVLGEFKIKWYKDFDEFYNYNKSKPILFISNELFDCFAINQYLKLDGLWVEKLIALNSKNNLQFVLAKRNKSISNVVSQMAGSLGKEGDIFEHSPSSDEFMITLSRSIKNTKGLALIIDYGYQENEFKDTLQALKDHKYSNIFENIGQSDLTSLVNFSRLEKIANKENLQSWIVSQKEFLESLGVEERRNKLLQGKSKKEKILINSSIDRLIKKNEMGELFKVLIIF